MKAITTKHRAVLYDKIGETGSPRPWRDTQTNADIEGRQSLLHPANQKYVAYEVESRNFMVEID